MERNKDKKANLESKRIIFFQIGMVLILLIVFAAFEYKSYEKHEIDFDNITTEIIDEEMVPITEHKKPPPPPPPPPQTTVIQIVNDDVNIVEDVVIDAMADETTIVDDYVPLDEPEDVIISDEPFIVVEQMPKFPGGLLELQKFIRDNVRYPVIAKETRIEGTVYVNFIIERDGSISNVKSLRPIGGGCDEEAIRVVSSMPNWSPGTQRGMKVRVSFNLPVKFKLK